MSFIARTLFRHPQSREIHLCLFRRPKEVTLTAPSILLEGAALDDHISTKKMGWHNHKGL